TIVQASSCPHHVTKVPHSYTAVHKHVCYLFVNSELYWREARDRCWDLGGEMLSIESQETMDFIKKKLNSPELSWDREGIWLGASKKSGKWKWTNGRLVNYTNWAPGQPSNLLGLLSVEDCSQMREDDGWKWHDIPCGSLRFHYNYICQFPLNKPGDVGGKVSSSAANQSEDNGNSSILAIIIGISTSLLLIMGIIFLVLYYHQRQSKQKASEVPVHFTNNTYSRTPNGSVHRDGQALPVPPSQQPFVSNEELYLDPQSNDKPSSSHMNSAPAKECKCVHQQSVVSSSICSSPGTDSELGACVGSDPEQEMKTPLMAANSIDCEAVGASCAACQSLHSCCVLNQGDYIDMKSQPQEKDQHRHTKEEDDKHTYSNVDHRDTGNENLYEVLP
ncbi:unnamed protein product, partial [Candidula unifasciata]